MDTTPSSDSFLSRGRVCCTQSCSAWKCKLRKTLGQTTQADCAAQTNSETVSFFTDQIKTQELYAIHP